MGLARLGCTVGLRCLGNMVVLDVFLLNPGHLAFMLLRRVEFIISRIYKEPLKKKRTPTIQQQKDNSI